MNYIPKAIQKTVATAGTEVQVSTASLKVRTAVVQAVAANTGIIYVGGSDVDATHSAHLAAGQSISLEAPGSSDYIDLSGVYVDASVNGDKANIIWLTPS